MDPLPHLFIIVNPTSGGNQAGTLTTPGIDYVDLVKPERCKMWFGDILEGEAGCRPIFLKLKATIEDIEYHKRAGNNVCLGQVRVVVAGGDGTVLWTISELEAHEIPFDSVAIGVIPFGTGNDFAKAMNWGYMQKNVFAKEWVAFHEMVRRWVTAEVANYDMWEIILEVDQEKGSFRRMSKKHKLEMVDADANGHETKKVVLKSKMLNYFSFGLESRIGMGFDRNRGKSRFANKVVYMNETLKKLFKRTLRIPDLIEKVEMVDPLDSTKVVETIYDGGASGPHMVGKPCSLICINIPSMFGGCPVWESSRGRVGQKFVNNKKAKVPAYVKADCKQHEGDGQLEFVTYQSSMGFGIEQLKTGKGLGRRLFKGPGPFKFTFKTGSTDNLVTYCQIDGEFFQVTCPKTLTVQLQQQIQTLRAVKGKKKSEIGKVASMESKTDIASQHNDGSQQQSTHASTTNEKRVLDLDDKKGTVDLDIPNEHQLPSTR
eukprot:Platyproteum_vivax@DN5069_c0_g1_i1.p1